MQYLCTCTHVHTRAHSISDVCGRRALLPPGYTPPPLSPASAASNSVRRSAREAEAEAGPLKFRLMVALSKVDLLPKEATQTRLVVGW